MRGASGPRRAEAACAAAARAVSLILRHNSIAGTITVSRIYDRSDRLPVIRKALTVSSD
jgi:hypothetical protein